MDQTPNIFSVKVFGKLQPYSPTISLARVRIFYKGANRNATYITEEFAEKLLSSLSYAPIKGIYDKDAKDFSDHGNSRTEGRIYGVVPEDPNLIWEKHLDEDGIEREYVCADVLLFTGIYPEANEIPGKSQSMEIYPPSIKGAWQVIDGRRVYVYTEGCFLGLQALGDTTDPCFEGSEFFSLYKNLKELIDEIKGGKRMINFKLSDSAKCDAIFKLLNPNFSEEGNWEMAVTVCNIYDEYAVCYDYEAQEFCRWYYQKDDQTDSVTIGERKKCFIIDVSEEEYQALNLLKTANEGSFIKIDEVYTAANTKIETLTSDLNVKTEAYSLIEQDLAAKNEIISQNAQEISGHIESYTQLKATLDQTVIDKDTVITELNTTIGGFELKEKESVISRFVTLLDEETLQPYRTNLATYSIEDLKKELAVKALDKNPNLFSQDHSAELIPTDGNLDNLTGAAKILMKHKTDKNRRNK